MAGKADRYARIVMKYLEHLGVETQWLARLNAEEIAAAYTAIRAAYDRGRNDTEAAIEFEQMYSDDAYDALVEELNRLKAAAR